MSVVEKSGVQNPLGQAGLATFYTGLYYFKAFTYDAVVETARGFYHGGRAIASADNTEDALMGVAGLYGSVGAAAGMVAGTIGIPQIASKIGNTTFVVPMLAGSEAALATVAIPTGSLVAGAMPGAIGIVMMASVDDKKGGGGKAQEPTKEEYPTPPYCPDDVADKALRGIKKRDPLGLGIVGDAAGLLLDIKKAFGL